MTNAELILENGKLKTELKQAEGRQFILSVVLFIAMVSAVAFKG